MSIGNLSQQFCVRWNSHLGSLGAAFPQLLAGQRFVDVTLACEGHQVHCHRLVLAACSSYFESLLGENPCKHPIIILPHDVKLWEVQALVDFMYKGEVNVSQAGLPDLLKCAEILQIRGLCGSDAALNLNQISNKTANRVAAFSTLPGNLRDQLASSILQTHAGNKFSNNTSKTNKNPGFLISSAISTNNTRPNIQPNAPTTCDNVNFLPPQLTNANLVDEPTASTSIGSATSRISIEDEPKTKGAHEGDGPATMSNNEGAENSPNESCNEFLKNDDTDESDTNDDMNDKSGKLQGDIDQQEEAAVHLDKEHVASRSLSNSTSNTSPLPEQPESIANYPPVRLGIDIIEINDYNESMHMNSTATTENANAGSIRVRPLDNLFENYKHHQNHHHTHQYPYKNSANNARNFNQLTNCDNSSPISLISLQPDIQSDAGTISMSENIHDNDLNGMEDIQDNSRLISNRSSENQQYGIADEDINYNGSCQSLPPALKFNRETMTIYVKSSAKAATLQKEKRTRHSSISMVMADNNYDDDKFESVVCSPNLETIADNSHDEFNDEYDDYVDNDLEIDNFNESDDISTNDLLNKSMSSMHDSELIICDDGEDIECDVRIQDRYNTRMSKRIPANRSQNIVQAGKRSAIKQERRSISDHDDDNSQLILMRMNKIRTATKSRIVNGVRKQLLRPKLDHPMNKSQCLPLPSAVVLRNPRGNQPRTYNTDALYAALMDVKSGESIYRASQLHKVPRKTLRNWMKRWDIKSAYPMPYQLKQAAEKKKKERHSRTFEYEKE